MTLRCDSAGKSEVVVFVILWENIRFGLHRTYKVQEIGCSCADKSTVEYTKNQININLRALQEAYWV